MKVLHWKRSIKRSFPMDNPVPRFYVLLRDLAAIEQLRYLQTDWVHQAGLDQEEI